MASCSKRCKHFSIAFTSGGYCRKFDETITVSQNIAHPGLAFHPMLPLYHFNKFSDKQLMDIAMNSNLDNMFIHHIELVNNIISYWINKNKLSTKQRDCVCRALVNCCFEEE